MEDTTLVLDDDKKLLEQVRKRRPKVEDLDPTVVYKLKKKKPRKKKDPGMRAYFGTVKNFQGFEKHLCCYEESVKDFVYVPRKYQDLVPRHMMGREFCKCCMLKPCITVVHQREISEKMVDLYLPRNKKEQTIANMMERFVMSKMRKYFGTEYLKELGTPNCVIEEVSEYSYDYYDSLQPR